MQIKLCAETIRQIQADRELKASILIVVESLTIITSQIHGRLSIASAITSSVIYFFYADSHMKWESVRVHISKKPSS